MYMFLKLGGPLYGLYPVWIDMLYELLLLDTFLFCWLTN